MSSSTVKEAAGLVETLRRSATTERLRTDHILTLELMQETMDENACLKEINKRLTDRLAQIGAAVDVGEHDAGASTNKHDNDQSAKESAQMVQRLLKQEKELSDLRAENKTLKSRSTTDERTIRDLQRRQSTYEQMRQELQKLKEEYDENSSRAGATQSEDSVAIQKELAELRTQLQSACQALEASQSQMASHVPDCHLRIAALTQELSMVSAREVGASSEATVVLKDIENKLATLHATHATLVEAHKSLDAKYRDLRRTADHAEGCLRERISVLQVERDEAATSLAALVTEHQTGMQAVQLENTKLQRLVTELQEEIYDLKRNMHNPLLLPAEVEDSIQPDSRDNSGFFLTGAPATTPPTVHSAPTSLPSNDFSEFVRLRKENKSLKLQLLQMSQQEQQRSGGRGSAKGSTIFG